MIRAALLTVLLVLATACQGTTGSSRCDSYPVPIGVANSNSYTVDCTPGYTSNTAGWTDESTMTVWVWPTKLSGQFLPKLMWHEAGHTVWNRNNYQASWWRQVRGIGGSVPDQTVEEDYAEVYGWCHYPLAGYSYQFAGPWPTQAVCT